MRQAGLLVELARRFPIDLVVAGDLPADDVAAAVRRVVHVPSATARAARVGALKAVTDRSYVPEVAAAAIARDALLQALADHPELRSAAVTVVTHLPLAPLLPLVPGASVFHPFHVVSTQLRGEADRSGAGRAWRLRRYAKGAARLESWAVRTASSTVAVCEADAASLGGTGRLVTVVPNAVDIGRDAVTVRPDAPVVLFPASLDYAPNADGALWAARAVWPRVREAVPDARLLLVGRSPGPDVVALHGHQGIEVHADVPDMAEWLSRARVVVVPLRFGTGTRIKALEAMAARRPVVGTTIGLAGLGLRDRVHAHIADQPDLLADRIVDALGPGGERIIEPARHLVEAHHSWPVVADRFAGVLEDLAPGLRR
jgi:glycosyltransferase involved in cell wall biosynthesis